MELTLAPNPLHDQQQTLHINKVATLIGENGSGKSSILQSVFEERLNKRAHHHLNVVCFSSGQNENYSEKFGIYLKRERQAGRGLGLECLYFDKPWSKLLIFLATATKRSGKVRSFLRERGYVTESAFEGDDQTTCLKCAFKIDKNYVNRVQDALKREESGEVDTLRNTPYFRSLDSFINTFVSNDYEFEQPLRKRTIEIPASRLIDVSFDYPRQPQAGEEGIEAGEANAQAQNIAFDPEVSFFTQAADNNYFIDKHGYKLVFKDGIELDQLSDGEYQLLFLYALIDLFDAPNTLFLFDEADSHLHYKNVEKLWSLLHSIQGHAITTTHLLDSISAKENRIEHLKVVEHGRINEDNKIKQLISRLSVLSRAKSVEFEVCGKLPNIALLDDYNDWIIFTKLAARAGLDINRLATVHAMKKSSSYATANETFGKGKIDWLHGLSKIESPLVTTQIFLICDRDEAALDWNAANGVQVNGQVYRELLNAIQWPRGTNVSPYLLAWKRREIKNYLLSYTALAHHNLLGQINNGDIAQRNHLQSNNPGDNDDIRRMNVKDIINPLINTDGEGLDPAKLQAYIDLIPPAEISEDITNMYNFIIGKL
ncbi:AAA family ATPase [Cronobacter sakazakii]|uniref:AAA family ATPase n=1 Tax=Cronobacter sakazakii TaxID=28141 RepID=UPI000DA243A0|nr:AAA family ATPase [Cronobacter sakazakii]ELY2493571.1 ATP-binding protein [Cronobacter sakazakii]ELY4327541.1 ATP-binding protein [Cronobacter sakazakii]ELY4765121.1 ATP-binding protein [Cronobacter sakazakii]ELY4851401.1 ATP-binding protein [Cronobacter sakazakii]ELY5876444.1 ATP-binding protein [Cronobacter sakazakii]